MKFFIRTTNLDTNLFSGGLLKKHFCGCVAVVDVEEHVGEAKSEHYADRQGQQKVAADITGS